MSTAPPTSGARLEPTAEVKVTVRPSAVVNCTTGL
jgi:hypothetical protein